MRRRKKSIEELVAEVRIEPIYDYACLDRECGGTQNRWGGCYNCGGDLQRTLKADPAAQPAS